MEEIWKDVPTYEGRYQVSNLGRARSIMRAQPHILATNSKKGPKVVTMVVDGVSHVYEVRHLVAYAFLGADITSPFKPKLRHKDGDITNIAADNLEIVTITDLEGEIWKDIPEFENIYQISNCGRVKRLQRLDKYIRKDTGVECIRPVDETLLKVIESSEYYEVDLTYSNIHRYARVHRLVAEAFIPNPDNLPQVNHIDGNKHNNHVSNLEWCTSEFNIQHAIQTGIRKNPEKGVYRGPVRVRCIETGQEFDNIKVAAEQLNLKYNYLVDCIDKNKQCHGLTIQRIKEA